VGATHLSGEGLVLTEVFFNDVKVAHRTSTAVIVVSYSGIPPVFDDLTDTVFNSSLGCQKVNLGSTGFKLMTTYVFGSYPNCNSYKYKDTYEFHNNGQWYHYITVYGPGLCNYTLQWYSPRLRHDYDVNGPANYFDEWTASGWTLRTVEGNYYYQSPYYAGVYDWRNYVPGKQITQAPAFNSYGPDHYILRYNGSSEFDGSPQPPIASWANGQAINGADIVNWFIPYVSPSPTLCQPLYPCRVGVYAPVFGY